jgi:hypothetical protein
MTPDQTHRTDESFSVQNYANKSTQKAMKDENESVKSSK